MGHLNVALVSGSMWDLGLFAPFEKLLDQWSLTLHSLDQPSLAETYQGRIPLKIYHQVKDMPGYLRGLEEEIHDCQLILCFESSTLASFQALRCGLKRGIPVVCVVTEERSFLYDSYENIRTIQGEIYRKAQLFIATSESAKVRLISEGLSEKKIVTIPPGVDFEKYAYHENEKSRFRSYLGIKPEKKIVLYRNDLTHATETHQLIQGLSAIKRLNPKRLEDLILLIQGHGEVKEQLKYQAYDLGLGKNVLFMEQDPTGFLKDFYRAMDALIFPLNFDPSMVQQSPRWVWDAMASGVVPFFPLSYVNRDFPKEVSITLPQDPIKIFQPVLELLGHPQLLAESKQQVSDWVRKIMNLNDYLCRWEETLSGVASQAESKKSTPSSVAHFLASARLGTLEERAQLLEAALEQNPKMDDLDRVQVWLELADTHLGLNHLTEAMNFYTLVTEAQPHEAKGYIGLGFVSLRAKSNEEAYAFFKRAVSLSQESSKAYLGLGYVHKNIGMPEEGAFWFLRCLRLDQKNSKALYGIIQISNELNHAEDAIRVLENARDVVEDHPLLMQALARHYIDQGHQEMGEQLLTNATPKKAS